MNKIEKLIEELCPNGVEFRKLGEIAKIKNGRDYKQFAEGNIPVYGSGGIMTYIDHFAYDKPSVLIPRKGSLGKLYYVETPFWNVDTIFYTEINEDLAIVKFVYYYLQICKLENLNAAAGVPSLTQTVLNRVPIPIPPLEIQKEIVQILDNFTNLAAELQAELQARKEQYEYYRNKLLSFDKEEVEFRKLGEVVKIKNGKDYKYLEEGNIPVYGSGGLMTYVNDFAYDKPSVLIPRKGSLGKLYYLETPFWNVDTIFYTEIDQNKLVPKFLFYYLQICHLENLNAAAGVPSLTQTVLNRVPIPILPLSEQQRIVNILDKFETLVNDLSTGLPAEIAAVQEQYEYYRNKLLTFKRAE